MSQHQMGDTKDRNIRILVMGVSASGKSTVGSQLAKAIGAQFIDGDDLHPPANIQKMRNKEALNDHDRQPWLDIIAERFRQAKNQGQALVIACSALKLAYRERLRTGDSKMITVYLKNDYESLLQRMHSREHFMPPDLLRDQFENLEEPKAEALVVDVETNGNLRSTVEEILKRIDVLHKS